MREMKHLSYSGFKLFESDPEMFYRRYLTEVKSPREPQNHYMAVGSAFDAFVKVDLHKKFIDDGDERFTLPRMFNDQVEEHGREQAWLDGQDVHKQYIQCGAFADLCKDMENCVSPRFEAEITALVTHPKFQGGVPILGKPDVMFVHQMGSRVIHDFKVNGYYSNTPPSPKTGYVKLMQHISGVPLKNPPQHPKAQTRIHKGILINGGAYFNTAYADWAEQLSFYAWTMGEEVGSDYVLSVDQICCNKSTKQIKVAKHAGICSPEYQLKLFERLHRAWYACANGHVFLDLPYEVSKGRQEAIELEVAAEQPDDFKMVNTRIR